MTDKVEKILSKIQTRKLCTMDEHMAFYNDKAKEDYELLCDIEEFIKAAQEEPVSEELEEAIEQSFIYNENRGDDFRSDEQIETAYRYGFVSGSNWKERQFEKNRIAHCEALTEEQAQIESDFVAKHLKDNNRTPTFIDAIEYGMRLHKEQMMKDAKSGIGNYDNYIKFEDGTWIDLDPSEQLKPAFNVNEGDKVKVIVIKED